MRILPKKPGALGVPLLCSQRPIQSHVDFTAQPPQQCLSQKAIVQVKQCTPFHVLIFSLLIHSSPSSQSVFSTEFIVQSCRCAGLSVDQLQDVPGVRRWQFCLNTRGAWLLGPLGSVCILWFNKQQQSLPRWLCHFSSHQQGGEEPSVPHSSQHLAIVLERSSICCFDWHSPLVPGVECLQMLTCCPGELSLQTWDSSPQAGVASAVSS